METLSQEELNEFTRFSNTARTCLCGMNPFLMTTGEMQEQAFKWAARLAEVEQTDNVCLLRAHLLNDIVDMDGRGVWSCTCMPDEDVDWVFEANEYDESLREDGEFMQMLHGDWANDMWQHLHDEVDWDRARDLQQKAA